ncbi:hypothetical protein Cgig2_028858 [Carnegiea gigantea]|uniref:Casein kinase substrate phosphoprotein PP28 domain-containing protein n=1 Tax=Carnegiea gigantea TaxID=171969 RepID=A0A9Q1KRC2_9CARY|nr:hypothetical protein Cgig2_028858 [Carnegiea gigantea]
MGRGKFKGKPTGRRQFSSFDEISAGGSSRPRTFRQKEAEEEEEEVIEEQEGSEEESDEDSQQKRKGTQGIIEIENPNLVKPKNVKAKNIDLEKTTELSRRERSQSVAKDLAGFGVGWLDREELERQRAHERYMKLQEQGKTEQARKDLGLNLEIPDSEENFNFSEYLTLLPNSLHPPLIRDPGSSFQIALHPGSETRSVTIQFATVIDPETIAHIGLQLMGFVPYLQQCKHHDRLQLRLLGSEVDCDKGMKR